MSDTTVIETGEVGKESILEKFQIQTPQMLITTLAVAFLGAIIYILLEMIPIPYAVVSLFKFGLVPALAIIAVVGVIRGPIAGLMTGYLGVLLHGIILNGVIVTFSLYGLAFGFMGFIVGLMKYDMISGRSLGKMSILSAIGLVFSVLLYAVFGILVEGVPILVVLLWQLITPLTMGLPSVALLTPLFARIWYIFMSRFIPNAL
ncbi:MAG: hypothetical protein ACTSQZ_00690 [Candidatus Thorarchaeota archaeon]